jgi:hypothetical protein
MLILLFLVPVAFAVIAFLATDRICWREFLCVLGAVLVVNTAGYFLSFVGATRDVELLNGEVTSKNREKVSCEHSYQCNCRQTCTGTPPHQTCHQTCDTCYEHSHDYDWVVHTTVSDVEINRVDRQGVSEPPRFTAVVIGEPITIENGYTNYIKAAPGSVLRMEGVAKDFPGLLPSYPRVYDYYRVNPTMGVRVAIPQQLVDQVRKFNADFGPAKQVNFMVVAVASPNPGYLHALEEAWLGGKKNDLIPGFRTA